METEMASLQLPKDLIVAAIEKKVQMAMAESLGAYTSILDRIVSDVLNAKVDNNGKPDNYSSKLTFLKWALDSALHKAVVRVLEEEIGKHTEHIRKNIVHQLSQKNSALLKNISESMAKGMTSALKNNWRLTVSYEDKE